MKETLMDALGMSGELFGNIPKITWLGKKDVTCENCGGLLTCEEALVQFSTVCGILTIRGESLCITALTDDMAIIGGVILSISYE